MNITQSKFELATDRMAILRGWLMITRDLIGDGATVELIVARQRTALQLHRMNHLHPWALKEKEIVAAERIAQQIAAICGYSQQWNCIRQFRGAFYPPRWFIGFAITARKSH